MTLLRKQQRNQATMIGSKIDNSRKEDFKKTQSFEIQNLVQSGEQTRSNHLHYYRNSLVQCLGSSYASRNVRFSVVAFFVGCLVVFNFTNHKSSTSSPLMGNIDYNDPNSFLESSFCNVDGTCNEAPDKPSPRTVYSARTKEQYEKWLAFHDKLKKRAESYAEKRKSLHSNHSTDTLKPPLILLGDSITESWDGTSMGTLTDRAKGIPEVLQSTLALQTDPLVLGIGGDQTQHLLYRLIDGELVSDIANDTSSMFVVLIGTNNLGAGELPGPTAKGIHAVVEYLLKNTKGTVVLFTLLPRGDAKKRLQKLCPPRCNSRGLPFTSFLPPIKTVNKQILNWKQKEYAHESRFHVLECGDEFLASNDDTSVDDDVKSSLMPDLLHPNAVGSKILSKCILSLY